MICGVAMYALLFSSMLVLVQPTHDAKFDETKQSDRR